MAACWARERGLAAPCGGAHSSCRLGRGSRDLDRSQTGALPVTCATASVTLYFGVLAQRPGSYMQVQSPLNTCTNYLYIIDTLHSGPVHTCTMVKSRQRLLTGTLCHTSQQPPSLGAYNPSYKARSLKTRGLRHVIKSHTVFVIPTGPLDPYSLHRNQH